MNRYNVTIRHKDGHAQGVVVYANSQVLAEDEVLVIMKERGYRMTDYYVERVVQDA